MKKFSKAITPLIEGYHHFRELYYHGTERKKFERLVSKGQKPKIMLISCCDSRVDPAVLFDTDPGDLFVVRNVANLVPPCDTSPHHHATSSALEFAVRVLKVDHVIVVGHTNCGGIRALMEEPAEMGDDAEHSFILQWMAIAKEARRQVKEEAADKTIDEQVNLCEHKSVEISYQNLKSFPFVQDAMKAGTLNLHAWVFDMENCILSVYDPETHNFDAIS